MKILIVEDDAKTARAVRRGLLTLMGTAIDLPDSLFREAKTRAVQSGVKFKVLVAQYIEAGLRGRHDAADPLRRVQVPLPVFRKA